jgi:hypothetical protein
MSDRKSRCGQPWAAAPRTARDNGVLSRCHWGPRSGLPRIPADPGSALNGEYCPFTGRVPALIRDDHRAYAETKDPCWDLRPRGSVERVNSRSATAVDRHLQGVYPVALVHRVKRIGYEPNRPADNQNRNQMVPALSISLNVLSETLLPNSPCSALLAFPEETVIGIARIKKASDDRPWRVISRGEGALAGACPGARDIERGDGSVLIPHEAVIHRACVDVIPRDRPRRVDGIAYRTLARACARARNIEHGDGAVLIPHEAVKYIAGIKVFSRDGPRWVDACGERALAGAFARAMHIKSDDEAIRSAHVPVIHIARVNVISRNRTCRIETIDCCGKGALAGAGPRARSIERGDGTIRGAHEAVPYVVRVKVLSCNRTCRVDVKGEGALAGAFARAGDIKRGDEADRRAHVAVSETVCIDVKARDCLCRVNTISVGAVEWAYTRAWNVERDEGAVASPHVAMVTIGIKCACDNALRADSIAVSALEEAMGSARGVERNGGGLPLVRIRGKDEPRCDQANRERQQERRAGRHTLQ